MITKKETPPCRAGQRQTSTTQSYKYRIHGFQGYFNMESTSKRSLSSLIAMRLGKRRYQVGSKLQKEFLMKHEASFVKDCAVGLWSEIIPGLASQLTPVVERGRKHGPCICGGKDRCRCHNDFHETGGIFCNQCGGGADGLAVLMWANGWAFRESLEAVSRHLNLGSGSPRSTGVKYSQPKDWSVERNKLEKIWSESEPNSTRVKEYFEHRGLSIEIPLALRFHKCLYHYKSGEKLPAMIARITRGDDLVGLHRTFLDPRGHGKALVTNPKLTKKCVESMSGGAIRLFNHEPGKPLVLCEGIETALAIREYSDWPVWPCVSSTMLEKIALPNHINEVVIGADSDLSGAGEQSAKALAGRLVAENRKVKVSLPPFNENSQYGDWLDYLVSEVTYA